jgi:stage II sporulation protein D
MSQYGADGMAKNGSNFAEILKHYYTGVDIDKLP